MGYDRNNETEIHKTPIQKFYAGKSILITGSTGFLGKMLVEKLLRSCSDISTMYLLIRPKKDKCPEIRLDDIFENPLYDRLKTEVPNFRKKIVPITANFNVENLELSESDKNMLMREVSVVFHLAATIRFDEDIKTSTAINVIATNVILDIAKHMPNLKSFIHVSTAYSNCHVKYIEERFYTYSIDHRELITLTRTLPESTIKERISRITSLWPNTYTFTKAIAEALLKHEGKDLPIGIFRPAIVISSASEPLVGWIDNFNGPIGITASVCHGITRFLQCNNDILANIVPVDLTVNSLIASAWDVSNKSRKSKEVLIYNYIAPADAPTWGEFINTLYFMNSMYPLKNSIWKPIIFSLQRDILYKICIWLCHLLPALLVDSIQICTGRRPRMWKLYSKVHKAAKVLAHFIVNKWNFTDDNVQAMWNRLNEEDRQLFKFNMIGFDWTKYLTNCYKGMRLYLFNEDESSLENSRIKYRRLCWLHRTLETVLLFVIFLIIWSILEKIFA
ncbi:unnamed protein product [Lasius platythorax]|uniref:Fatty acyl-CoA reductase n=1 Tax=Lasius platythorax TaxID=488582 RepID=A0AAV2PBE1_9HYME